MRVVRGNKSLLVFPVLSTLATLAVLAATLVWVGAPFTLGNVTVDTFEWRNWPVAVVAYFVLSFVTIFCDAALAHAANEAMLGRPATRHCRPAWAAEAPQPSARAAALSSGSSARR